MKSKIVLYIICLDRQSMSYNLISEHPEKYAECSRYIKPDSDLDNQIINLFNNYLDLSPDYIKFLHLKPYIYNQELVIPFYCLVPYNSYEFKNSYKIPCKQYVETIPDLRKILNTI